MAFALPMKKQKNKKRGSMQERRNRVGLYFIIPFLIVLGIFSIYPVFRTFFLSFTSYKGFGDADFVAMDNYRRVLSDPLFWGAFKNTMYIWAINIVVQIGLALLLTVIFSDIKYRMKGIGLFRALFYLPNLIAATSVAFLFNTLLDWRFGSVNQILIKSGLISQGIDWLGQPGSAQFVVAIIGAWMWFGSTFIMLMAGVQGISKDYFEAATIDGASRWQILRKITLPLLKPIMLYVAITSLIGGLQMFDIPFLISGGTGAPDRALVTVVVYLYTMAFKNRQVGYAAAIAFMLFIIIVFFSMITYRIMYKKDEEA
ncbi:MAG: carbohydrate ABC transporter permease [Erysipelotrichaceae bacterium]